MAPRSWLSVTPEPERELPDALATLRHEGTPPEEAVERERERIEGLILRGRRRDWVAYMGEALATAERARDVDDPDVERAREVAETVIVNHNNLLLGLPD
jgi:hypothetical protein